MAPVQDSQPVPPAQPDGPDAPAATASPSDGAAQLEQAGEATPVVTGESVPASPAPPGSPSAGLIAVGILIGLCLVGGLVVMMVRRRLLQTGGEEAGVGSLMESLRGMLKRGEISQEEFDAAKRSMATRLAAKAGVGIAEKPPGGRGEGV